jgi:two-component system OmpR family sensor kinase
MRAIRSRFPASLRWRLTAWVAAVMLIAAAVVFVVVYTSTGNQLQGQIERDIAADTVQLSQYLRPFQGQSPARRAANARRYMRAQPYSSTSTLLFVLIPGVAPVTNHPEVFGSARPESGETEADQASENASSLRLRVPKLGYSTQRVADVGRVRVFERPLSLRNMNVVVGAGEPLALVESAQHGIARAFVIAGAIVLALALAASYLAGARVTAPLRRMAAVAARVDAGDLEPRMDTSAAEGQEVRVLADSFNHMLDRLAEAFAGQREFVADASHELRTPLTVIRGQLEVLVAQTDPPAAEVRRVERLVQAEITRITRLVDDLLVLARAERLDFLHVNNVELRPFVEDLWDGVSLTADRHFELGPVPDGSLQAYPDRLAQALRNLAGNAISHTSETTGRVRLEVQRASPDRVRFAVLDDGPGIPPDERERIFERFHRVDPGRARAEGGAGLGLAIVRAIAEAHGGQVRAVAPLNGEGARLELLLPGFQPL